MIDFIKQIRLWCRINAYPFPTIVLRDRNQVKAAIDDLGRYTDVVIENGRNQMMFGGIKVCWPIELGWE